MPKELPILRLADAAAWRNWLAREGSLSEGVMLATIKKGAQDADTNLRYDQALDEALCYGWIDSGGRKVDDSIYLFRFCPRKPGSLWSKRNVSYVERLEKENRMQPAGRATIEAAKANGRWASAYSGSGNTEMPPDFLAALEKAPAAKATWEQLNKGNRWRIYFRLNNLKTAAGREKRIQADVEDLARGKPPTPQKRTPAREKSTKKGDSSSSPALDSSSESTQQKSRRQTRTGRFIPSYTE
ncbi:hypothetical protein DPSP01_012945 [Paraphaeosphaeria sporulosa]|uniref:Bacteriocin-protection protein n=1 Tax=Paraphaeosphaeria sporulosa TaxID=1460663 RepID=A0A177BWW7_9PLEO|nr:uncharacterized protein CC84DRAFT_374366 [Paraphaeosphaeria sporulosa]OAF99635.1 hypothetical protein CC84DRAFT_374366 [Paraphaeosphaeria sporulosa]